MFSLPTQLISALNTSLLQGPLCIHHSENMKHTWIHREGRLMRAYTIDKYSIRGAQQMSIV